MLISSCGLVGVLPSPPGHGPLRLRGDLFDLQTPFRLDAQVDAEDRRAQALKNGVALRERRKRKAAAEPPVELTELAERLLEDLAAIRSHFPSAFSTTPPSDRNNQTYRRAGSEALLEREFFYRVEGDAGGASTSELPQTSVSPDAHVAFDTEHINSTEDVVSVRFRGRSFLVPPRSSFVLGDVGLCGRLPPRTFDFVLLDPPWINRSVKRKKSYWTEDEAGLGRLALGRLVGPGGLAAVWTTNNVRIARRLRDDVFPAWGLRPVAEIRWLKVTRAGEAVCALDASHKLPVETLVLLARATDPPPDRLPKTFTFAAVPSAVPSHKPPVIELVRKLSELRLERCAELFARYLQTDFLSVGDEVLKLQHTGIFHPEDM